jgi:hypothetical protein
VLGINQLALTRTSPRRGIWPLFPSGARNLEVLESPLSWFGTVYAFSASINSCGFRPCSRHLSVRIRVLSVGLVFWPNSFVRSSFSHGEVSSCGVRAFPWTAYAVLASGA